MLEAQIRLIGNRIFSCVVLISFLFPVGFDSLSHSKDFGEVPIQSSQRFDRIQTPESITSTMNSLQYLAELYNGQLTLLGSSLLQDYEDNMKKHLISFTGEFPLTPVVGLVGGEVDIFIDADDLYSAYHSDSPDEIITTEGEAGWVTVWVDGGFSVAGVSFTSNILPIGIGFTKAVRFVNEDDPTRRWELSGPGGCAMIQGVKTFTKSSSVGYDWDNDSNLLLECVGLKGSLAQLSWNVMRFEIQIGTLEGIINPIFDLMPTGIIDDALIEQIGNMVVGGTINNDDNYELSHGFTWPAVRKFTSLEDNVYPPTTGALLDYGYGGEDLNGDGRLDNYFLENTRSILRTYGHTTGNSEGDYLIKVKDFSDGWSIDAIDFDFVWPWDDHVWDLEDIPGDFKFEPTWEIIAPPGQIDGYVILELWEVKCLGLCNNLIETVHIPLWSNPENVPLPPEPPSIIHTPITQAVAGQQIAVSANVLSNNSIEIQDVILKFGYDPECVGPFYSRRMSEINPNEFQATIPGSDVHGNHITYIIEVYDQLFTTSPNTGCYETIITQPIEPTYSISGYITDSSDNGVEGVTVTAGSFDAVTELTGYYEIPDVPNGTYNVIPTRSGYIFSPSVSTINVNGEPENVDFTGSLDRDDDTFTFFPTEDTYVNEGCPTCNYGAANIFGSGLFYSGGDYLNRLGLLKFSDLATIQDENVYSADLQIYAENFNGNDTRLDLHRLESVTSDWEEDTTTYQNGPIDSFDWSGEYIGEAINNSDTWFTYSNSYLNTWVQEWVNGTTPNRGLIIVPHYSNIDSAPLFSSREGAHPPMLVVKILTGIPDLVVSEVWADPMPNPKFTVGQTVLLNWTVFNNGPGGADYSRAAAYIGDGPSDLSKFIDDNPSGQLLAGNDDSDWVSYTFVEEDIGTKYFIVRADSDSDVTEAYETNNINIIGPYEVISQNTNPTISNLPDIFIDEGDTYDDAIDLWNYAIDGESEYNELIFSINNNPEPSGGVQIENNRFIDISPLDHNWFGSVDVEISVIDPGGGEDIDVFQVVINPVNDNPWIYPDIPDRQAQIGNGISIDLSIYERDVEDSGNNLDWHVTGFMEGVILGEYSDEDIITFIPNPDLVGSFEITLHLVDSEGGEVTQELILEWTDLAEPPPIGVWENMGIYGGIINDVVVDPSNDWIYLVLNGYPGIYRSEDNGVNWHSIGPGYAAAQRIILDNDGVLYTNFNGLAKSENDGINWDILIDSNIFPKAGTIPGFDVNPNNPDYIVVGTGAGLDDDGKVYYTRNGGLDWFEANINVPVQGNISSIVFDPRDLEGNIVYAINNDSGNFNTPSHLYYSNDGGANFWIIYTLPIGEQFYVVNINDLGTLFVGGTSGLLRKSDEGEWEQVIDDADIIFIEFDVNSTETVYVDSYVGYEDGTQWEPLGVSEFFAQSPNDPELMFTVSGLGIKRSEDSGVNWEEAVTGVESVTIWSVAADAGYNQILFAGSGQGVAWSINGGADWEFPHSGIPGDRRVVATSPILPGIVYVGDIFGWIAKSENYGNPESWNQVQIDPLKPAMITDIAIDPLNSERVFASAASYDPNIAQAFGGLYVSEDGGTTWEESLQNLPVNKIQTTVTSDGTVIYAGVGDYWSASLGNGGVHRWTEIEGWQLVGLPNKVVNALAINPYNSDIIYAGTVRENFDPEPRRPVYKSINGGDSWDPLNLENCGDVETIVIDPSDPRIIYESSCGQIYQSNDSGDHWHLFLEGKPGEQFQALYIPSETSSSTTGSLLIDPTSIREAENKRTLYLASSMGLYRYIDATFNMYMPIILMDD